MSTGKSVFITGCSDGGLGSALALVFQARGFHVFASARSTSKLADLASLSNVTLVTLDVLDQNQIAAAVDSVKAATVDGKLDILINNTGRNHFSPALDVDIVEAKQIFDINYWGALAVIQAFAPLLIKAEGSLVNVTSIAGHTYVPYMSVYSASKRSLELLGDTLRLELEPFKVKVTSVVTGAVDSKGLSYFQDWKLPETSLYKPLEALIASRARGNDGVQRASRADYADEVVSAIIKGDERKIWAGANAAGAKARTIPSIPQAAITGYDQALIRGCGLDQLAKK